jgi:hypothetical protein
VAKSAEGAGFIPDVGRVPRLEQVVHASQEDQAQRYDSASHKVQLSPIKSIETGV